MTVKTATQATLDEALGMARSGEHADRKQEAWRERALSVIRVFCMDTVDAHFLTENVREFAEANFPSLSKPPDGRAWGSVMREAQRRGLIEQCCWLPARSSNLSPKRAWLAKRGR